MAVVESERSGPATEAQKHLQRFIKKGKKYSIKAVMLGSAAMFFHLFNKQYASYDILPEGILDSPLQLEVCIESTLRINIVKTTRRSVVSQ